MIKDMITRPQVRTALFCVALFLLVLPMDMTDGVMTMTSANAEDAVVAVVNNESIHASDLEKLITQYKKRAQKQELTLDELKQLVNNLAIRKIILQHPDAQALKNDAEIRRKVKVFEEGLIVSDFVTGYVNTRVFVTEEDLRNYYKTHKDQFTVDKVQTGSAILLRTRKEAEEILARVSQGEDFGKLAGEFSLDLRTAKNGGSLGVVEKAKVPEKMWAEVMKLEAGQVGDIVETKYGYVIVKVDQVVSSESLKPFEEVREEVRQSFIPKQREQIYDAMVVNLKKDADIEIFDERVLETSNPPS
jgi:parvulin-like peptidyl-prolyl isomerase